MIGAAKAVDICDGLTKQHGARFTTPDTLRDMAAKGDGFYSRFAA